MSPWELVVVVGASYVVGAIPTGYLAGRIMRGIDIRDYGSGVIGATNVHRVLGTAPFILVMIADALKGYTVVFVTWQLFHTHDLQVASGISAVLGHDYPVYIGFRGGRGVAVSFGVYAALAMPLAVGMVAFGLFIALTLRYMSVMSMVTVPGGALVLLLLAILRVSPEDFTYTKTIFGAFATFFVLITHIGNIRRLVKGTEPKIGDSVEAEPGRRRRARVT